MKRIAVMLMLSLLCAGASAAVAVKKVEPTSWWVGMRHPLQLMFYGTDLKGAEVSIDAPGIKVKQVHTADSPNYLFVDVAVAADAKPGNYTFVVKKGKQTTKVPYTFAARKAGSADRSSWTAKDAIYLLMPDRFAQGELPKGLPALPGKVDRSDPNARHGGNLQGMIDRLDYIAELGATAVWSTPLTEDREEMSYHGYAITDYYTIDPRYGTNELYKQYVDASHEKGLKVIMDLVPNHCGLGHWWMADLPFTDWVNNGGKYTQTRFTQTAQFDPHAAKSDFENNRDGWFAPSMPDMNLRNEFVLNYLAQNAIWWAEYSGLDGFRVDTYPYNDKHKAAEWTRRITDEYPNMNVVAECWVGEPAMVAYWEGAAQNKDGYSSGLPSVMDFPLQQRLVNALSLDRAPGWGEGAQGIYFVVAQDFLYQNPNSLLIFASNHDVDRLAKTLKSHPAKQMLAYSLLATMRGVPQLYYGDELLFHGDHSAGDGGKRIDFPGGWKDDARNLFEGKGLTPAEDSVYRHVKRLFNWRKTSRAAHEGALTHFWPTENQYAYGRATDDELVFVVLNFNGTSAPVRWEAYGELFEGRPTEGTDVVSGKTVKVGEPLILPAYGSLVLELKK